MPLAAIILAAGDSARMGRPKALLEYEGLPFIERACSALRFSGITERVVVLGRHAAAVLSAWKPSGEKIALNPQPEQGQLSSLRTGLAAAGKDAEGFMVCLVDQPSIKPETYKQVITFWCSNRTAIVIPRYPRPASAPGTSSPDFPDPHPSTLGPRFKRGHPIVIPAAYRNLCFEGPLDKGLHWVTHHPSVQVMDLNVNDPGIIVDCDTPEDYRKLLKGA